MWQHEEMNNNGLVYYCVISNLSLSLFRVALDLYTNNLAWKEATLNKFVKTSKNTWANGHINGVHEIVK